MSIRLLLLLLSLSFTPLALEDLAYSFSLPQDLDPKVFSTFFYSNLLVRWQLLFNFGLSEQEFSFPELHLYQNRCLMAEIATHVYKTSSTMSHWALNVYKTRVL